MRVDRAVDAYLRHITIERGLSEHTVGAYRRDLAVYLQWLSDAGIDDTTAVTGAIIGRFIADRSSVAPAPAATSLARLQSSVRGLHRFLVREGIEVEDPTGRLRPPKMPQRLPKALTIDQVERLLAAPSAENPLGIRDRALLELLYATGARVSEAVGLDVDDLAHGDVLRLRGKTYPFTVSGMSVGLTVGASTTKFVGRALNLRGPASIEGSYAVGGAGGAIAAGAGAVQLQNANGVILQLSGPKVGAEVSAAIGGVTIRLK